MIGMNPYIPVITINIHTLGLLEIFIFDLKDPTSLLFVRDTCKTHSKTLRKFERKRVKKIIQATSNLKNAESRKWNVS